MHPPVDNNEALQLKKNIRFLDIIINTVVEFSLFVNFYSIVAILIVVFGVYVV